jgi:ABC-type uncharacterized transport system ATPase subunit
MGEPAIEVRGLRKSVGEKEAVAGVGLEIAAGSLAGLVGRTGPASASLAVFLTLQTPPRHSQNTQFRAFQPRR